MKRIHWMLALLAITTFVLQACGGAATVDGPSLVSEEGEQGTSASLAEAVAEAVPSRARDNSAEAEAEDETAAVDVQQLANGPTVTVSQATNCRSGPGKDYDLLAIVEAWQSVEVVATYPFGPYVVVDNPNGFDTCWLWLEHADNSDFSAFDLPEAERPPLPEPKPEDFDWSGYWTAWVEGTAYTFYVYVDGSNFTGEFIDGYGQSVRLSGQITSDGRIVNGSWVWGGRSSSFRIQARGQEGGLFVGHWGPSFGEFCGARETLPQPAPCLGP